MGVQQERHAWHGESRCGGNPGPHREGWPELAGDILWGGQPHLFSGDAFTKSGKRRTVIGPELLHMAGGAT
jgi:hypothetical protein